MAADIEQLQQTLTTFAGSMQPSKRRALMKQLSGALLKINQRRMDAETAPDGTKWPERISPARAGKPEKMMRGLRRNLKASATTDQAVIGFPGRVGKIALVHHQGLRDAVSPNGPRVQYQLRELIGIAGGDLRMLERIILEGI